MLRSNGPVAVAPGASPGQPTRPDPEVHAPSARIGRRHDLATLNQFIEFREAKIFGSSKC